MQDSRVINYLDKFIEREECNCTIFRTDMTSLITLYRYGLFLFIETNRVAGLKKYSFGRTDYDYATFSQSVNSRYKTRTRVAHFCSRKAFTYLHAA